jgi:hypothetical protein
MHQSVIKGYIEPLSKTYEDGSPVLELYLAGPNLDFVPPPRSEPVAIELRVGARKYSAYLRRYPQTGQVYVTPTLIDYVDSRRTTLGRVLTEAGLSPGEHVTVHLLAGDLTCPILDLAIPAN